MKSFAFILFVFCTASLAQDTTRIEKVQYRGYVKDMQSLNFSENFSNLTTGNLIHSRFNLRVLPAKRITASLELRSRLFWGEEVRIIPGFSSHLRNRNEAVNLSRNLIDEEAIVLNTTIDRLWFEYRHEKWNVRVGRQRINWCVGTTWNPNDLFNTYNFLDFDYEERPGADGFMFHYATGEMDHLEFAASFNENNEIITAVKYFRNISDYDLQFIAGVYNKRTTLGMGWSGNIKESGFRGEAQYFFKQDLNDDQLNVAIEVDHVFSHGWYVSAAAFMNSSGIRTPFETGMLTAMQLSPTNLMPTRWNMLISFSKELTPLASLSSSFIYAAGTNLLIVLPTISYNLAENLDASVVWQSFFSEQGSEFEDVSHRCFLRFKWSY